MWRRLMLPRDICGCTALSLPHDQRAGLKARAIKHHMGGVRSMSHQRGAGDASAPAAGEWPELLERGRKLAESLSEKLATKDQFNVLDAGVVSKTLLEVAHHLFGNPARLQQAQAALAEDYARLWRTTSAALEGKPIEPVIEPGKDDRRFKDPSWTENPLFDTIKQYYLINARWLDSLVREAEGLDPKTQQKALFYLRQLISAMAPTNFVATNPKVLQATLDSNGENLRRGYASLLDHMERGNGRLRIPLTDEAAFELGRNIATTPGKVVHQTELAQLIQYTPTTDTVWKRPLLIVPPWINKFYVLDLQPKNSFIRWAVEQGHTVFVLSWINPDASLAHKRFDDYVLEGPVTALDVIAEITGERQVNAIGYCIGGTLLACTLAHLAAKGDDRIASATYFTTMIDFADPGELGVFIDEAQIGLLEGHLRQRGYLEGAQMAQVFNLLRENDLIWSAFINNYLMGKDPPAFDLLYWNSDSTRMPAMMHTFYLREMYLQNRLIEPNALSIAGTPIDLRRITAPSYILATREDHIAPWRSSFAAVHHYGGPVRFVLAASGHIAGVINPPSSKKYGYWTHSRKTKSPDAWLVGATRHEGSWWPDWQSWIARRDRERVPARAPGSERFPPIEDAPGSFVRVRAQD
jgi:polyhydroxyalkanoate synthase